MKIYKISERMFDLMGAEKVVMSAFKNLYQKALSKNKKDLNQINKSMKSQNGFYHLGEINISSFMERIFSKHGVPKNKEYPKSIWLELLLSSSKVGKNKQALIGEFSSGEIFIAKTVESFNSVKFDEYFEESLRHELQHLTRFIYRSNKSDSSDMESALGGMRDNGYDYYSNKSEIQAFSESIARNAFKTWQDLFLIKLENLDPQQKEEFIKTQKSSNLVIFLNDAIKYFDKRHFNILKSNPELKDTYLYYSWRNLESIFNQFMDRQRKNN